MKDRETVIEALKYMISGDCTETQFDFTDDIEAAIALLEEQEKLVDVDALREKLGLAKDCAKCKQNTRKCQYDSHFSLMDFCEMLDVAIEDLLQEGR